MLWLFHFIFTASSFLFIYFALSCDYLLFVPLSHCFHPLDHYCPFLYFFMCKITFLPVCFLFLHVFVFFAFLSVHVCILHYLVFISWLPHFFLCNFSFSLNSFCQFLISRCLTRQITALPLAGPASVTVSARLTSWDRWGEMNAALPLAELGVVPARPAL